MSPPFPRAPSTPTSPPASPSSSAPIVTDLTALAVNGKQAHWHVRGINFIAVHELIDVVVDHAQEYADPAAERVVALGLPVDGRIETVAAKTTTPRRSRPASSRSTHHRRASSPRSTRPSSPCAPPSTSSASSTPPAQDVAIEIARGLEKDRWFLAAHVAG